MDSGNQLIRLVRLIGDAKLQSPSFNHLSSLSLALTIEIRQPARNVSKRCSNPMPVLADPKIKQIRPRKGHRMGCSTNTGRTSRNPPNPIDALT